MMQGLCQTVDGERPDAAICHLEVPDAQPAGDCAVYCHHLAAGGGASEAQEFPDQMAATAPETPLPGDAGAAHHARASGVQEDPGRGLPAAHGWQTAFSQPNRQVPDALLAAGTTSASASAAPRPFGKEGSCAGGRR